MKQDTGKRSGVVYLIGEARSTSAKIGTTTDVAGRLRELQRGSAAELHVLSTVAGSYCLESLLHRHFKAQRLHGEWFDFGVDDRVEAFVAAAGRHRAQAEHDEAEQRLQRALNSHSAIDRYYMSLPYGMAWD